MSYLNNVIRSKIFNDFSKSEQQKYFSIKAKKTIHGIDTLYFSVSLDNDLKDLKDENIINFIKVLNELKNSYEEDLIEFDSTFDLYYKNANFGFYKHCLSKNHMFDIFIADKIINDETDTPRLIVQIRSNMLWSFGERYSINYIYKCLVKILGDFNITIKNIKENRIDYCFHTNYLQDTDKYFSDDYIRDYLDTSFKIGSKVFRKDKKSLKVDYLSLGNRKSNNLFFRTYNKTKEVVELGYKDFFLDIWLSNNLISLYDYHVLTFAYQNNSYNKIYEGMLRFYIDYGHNIEFKETCKKILSDVNLTLDKLRKFAILYFPRVTLIQNFEFQTMRKFYFSGNDIIDFLPISEECEPKLLRLFQILDNRKIFLDYLLNKAVVFRKLDLDVNTEMLSNKEYVADFWYRIQNLKLDKTLEMHYKRQYNNNNNKVLMLNKIKSCLATYSLYNQNDDTNIITDMCNLLNDLNDNDIENLKRYDVIKRKKAKAQKNINILKTLATDND